MLLSQKRETFSQLFSNRKGLIDVFTGSAPLLIHLEAKNQRIGTNNVFKVKQTTRKVPRSLKIRSKGVSKVYV